MLREGRWYNKESEEWMPLPTLAVLMELVLKCPILGDTAQLHPTAFFNSGELQSENRIPLDHELK